MTSARFFCESDQALELPEWVNPARWPFCEARARAAAALVAFPDPPARTRYTRRAARPARNQVAEAAQRRATQRAQA